MSQSSEEAWAKAIKLGRKQFILRFGVLAWGVPTAIMFSIAEAYLHGWDTYPTLCRVILFPLGGILWGHCMWKLMAEHATATTSGMKE